MIYKTCWVRKCYSISNISTSRYSYSIHKRHIYILILSWQFRCWGFSRGICFAELHCCHGSIGSYFRLMHSLLFFSNCIYLLHNLAKQKWCQICVDRWPAILNVFLTSTTQESSNYCCHLLVMTVTKIRHKCQTERSPELPLPHIFGGGKFARDKNENIV